MIAFIKGVLAYKGIDSCIVEAGGVGYSMGMSANALASLPELGSEVLVPTYLQLGENGASLFGFADIEEKEMFERLIGVGSVGPKMALAALSTFRPAALSSAIMASDVDAISHIPGIGKKKASRIVLELQGCLAHATEAGGGSAGASLAQRAAEDLLAMGFTSAEAELALRGVPDESSEAQALQYALKRLGQ